MLYMIYKNFNVFCIVSYTLQCIYCAAYTIITFTKSFIQQFSSAKTSRVTVATLHIAHTSGFRHFTLKHAACPYSVVSKRSKISRTTDSDKNGKGFSSAADTRLPSAFTYEIHLGISSKAISPSTSHSTGPFVCIAD
jgi:hypothetical protein